MIRVTFLIVLSLWCSLAQGQVFIAKPCNSSLVAMQQFDINRFSGQWYEVYKYAMLGQANPKCVYAIFDNYSNGTFSVKSSKVSGIGGRTQNSNGKATFLGDPTVAKFSITFKSRFFGHLGYASDYLVLGTDYTNYAVVYTCNKSAFNGSLQTVWIYSRTQILSQNATDKALEIMDKNGLIRTPLIHTTQIDCSN